MKRQHLELVMPGASACSNADLALIGSSHGVRRPECFSLLLFKLVISELPLSKWLRPPRHHCS